MTKQLWALIMFVAVAFAPARAAVITFQVTGAINEVDPALASVFTPGTPLSAIFSYNTSVTDAFADPGLGDYPGSFSINALFGSYAVGGTGGGVSVANDESFGPLLSDRFTGFLTDAEISGAAVGGLLPVRLELSLQDFDATVFASDQLPAASQLANVSAFEDPSLVLFFQDFAIVNANITALQIQQISEPYSVSLLACGLIAFACARRQQRVADRLCSGRIARHGSRFSRSS